MMEQGELFVLKKHDRSTTVGVMRGEVFGLDCPVLVKRFNYRGIGDLLFKIISGGRARRLWKISLRLLEKGLPVATPLAYFGPSFTRRHSFFLSSYVEDAENLGSLYKKERFLEPGRVAASLGALLSAAHLSGVVHGDLKWSNILIKGNGDDLKLFLVDLDQTRIYSRPDPRGMIKDLVRFYRYGLELGAQAWVDELFFPSYLAGLPDAVRAGVDLSIIRETALSDWESKGRRRCVAD